MTAYIEPSEVGGTAAAPPSKSMAHRAVLAAALARGVSRIEHLEFSQDVSATLGAVSAMGARVKTGPDWAEVLGRGGFATLLRPVDCGESGSTLRFLIPVLSLCGQQVQFTGRGRLFARPQNVYQDIFLQQGLLFCHAEQGILLKGALSPGEYRLPGGVSSQFISGLLFALPLLQRPSTIRVLPPFESRPYVDMTLAALADFGVEAHFSPDEPDLLEVPAPQRYRNRDYTVEGDYSQAAFLAVLGAVRGGITVTGLRPDSLQGDAAILSVLERCGASFCREGDAVHFEKSPLHAVDIDLACCPDLGPVLMVLGAFCEGETVIYNAGRLRLKESDRIEAMQKELEKFGVKISATEDTVRLRGGRPVLPSPLEGHNDHRVVMSLAVMALAAGLRAEIHGAEAVRKSWPGFFEVLNALNAKVVLKE